MTRTTQLVVVVDQRFLPGLVALLQSLGDHGAVASGTRVIVVYTDGRVLHARAALRHFPFAFEFVDWRWLGGLSPDHLRLRRRSPTFDKLLLFNLPEREPLLYLDVDMLCLGPLNELARMDHFTAAIDIGMTGPRSVGGHLIFNTGMMVFRPDTALYRQLCAFGERCVEPLRTDQHLLNYYFNCEAPGTVRLAPRRFNTLKRLAIYFPQAFDLSDISLLHFVGQKPWTTEARRPERGYAQLHQLWWRYYRRALASMQGPSVLVPAEDVLANEEASHAATTDSFHPASDRACGRVG